MTNLNELDLGYTSISSSIAFLPLSNLTNLTDLDLSGLQICDISVLADFSNLQLLMLDSNQITDISPLQNLSNLSLLYLDDNQVSNLAPLGSLSNLEKLSLDSNQIADISALRSLSNLWGLILNSNQITDISPLQSLSNLELLSLDNNQVNNITSLSNLSNLQVLDLDSNQITDISPLQNLSNLNQLSLNSNQISDISALASLSDLNCISLNNNKITDISSLVTVSENGYLGYVDVSSNYLDLTAGSQASNDIDLLQEFIEVVYQPQNTSDSMQLSSSFTSPTARVSNALTSQAVAVKMSKYIWPGKNSNGKALGTAGTGSLDLPQTDNLDSSVTYTVYLVDGPMKGLSRTALANALSNANTITFTIKSAISNNRSAIGSAKSPTSSRKTSHCLRHWLIIGSKLHGWNNGLAKRSRSGMRSPRRLTLGREPLQLELALPY